MNSRHFAIYAKQYTVLFHFTFFFEQNSTISYLFYDKADTRISRYSCALLHIFFRNTRIVDSENEASKVHMFNKVPVLNERNATWNAISNHGNKKRGANITPQHPAAAVWNISRCDQHYSELFSRWKSDRTRRVDDPRYSIAHVRTYVISNRAARNTPIWIINTRA